MPADPTKVAVDDGVQPNPPGEPRAVSRQCSRCRAHFPLDPTLLFTTAHAWWLCAACEPALLGGPKVTT